MITLYWTGQNSGFGDTVKGISAIKVFAESLGEKIRVAFIMPVHVLGCQRVHQIKTLVEDCLVPCEFIEWDWEGTHSIIDSFFDNVRDPVTNEVIWKPEVLWNTKESLQNFIDGGELRSERLRSREDVKKWCNENKISPYQLITFRYTPVPYWKAKQPQRDPTSKVVTIQSERFGDKGIRQGTARKIIEMIEKRGWTAIVTNGYTDPYELMDTMSHARFHIAPPSGTAHIAGCLSLPCLIVVPTMTPPKWSLHQGMQDIGMFQYAPSRQIDQDEILQVTNWDDEIEKTKYHLLNMVENDIKFLQMVSRMSYEKQDFTGLPKKGWPNDQEIIEYWSRVRWESYGKYKE